MNQSGSWKCPSLRNEDWIAAIVVSWGLGALRVATSVIGASHQRPRFDIPKSHSQRRRLQAVKFVWRVILIDRYVLWGWRKVLTNSQNIAAGFGDITECRQQ